MILLKNLSQEDEIKVINFLKTNRIKYEVENWDYSHDLVDYGKANPNKCNINLPITITTSVKEVCRVYPKEIIYVVIENRKSVVYTVFGKIETNCLLRQWLSVLDSKEFSQPHYSYIVNLNYVEKITKDKVILRYKDERFSIYTSVRKVKSFKTSFIEFSKNEHI